MNRFTNYVVTCLQCSEQLKDSKKEKDKKNKGN